ncbi:MAG TPA: hypothetical protein VFM34_08875, partial [Moraxellaceae bacterium]|nr:hypothetical protein [Moraxellaceae bacterium]
LSVFAFSTSILCNRHCHLPGKMARSCNSSPLRDRSFASPAARNHFATPEPGTAGFQVFLRPEWLLMRRKGLRKYPCGCRKECLQQKGRASIDVHASGLTSATQALKTRIFPQRNPAPTRLTVKRQGIAGEKHSPEVIDLSFFVHLDMRSTPPCAGSLLRRLMP